jgi:hypothetical protein
MDKDALVNRMINTWDGDAEDLLMLVTLLNRIRLRAMRAAVAAERERIAAAITQDMNGRGEFEYGPEWYDGVEMALSHLNLASSASANSPGGT